jgi:sugar O-acyltransferase (sialic acid O-acetyltransferase NeuD family)
VAASEPASSIPVAVVGGGGLGNEIIDAINLIAQLGRQHFAGVLDDRPDAVDAAQHLGPIDAASVPSDHQLIMAIGDPEIRLRLVHRLGPDATYASVVHPTAVVSPLATIGDGVFIGPFAFVGPNAVVADHAVLNVYSSVGHDARLERGAVLSPYATLNGHATVGEGVFLGTNAAVGIGVEVGAWSKVSSGAVCSRSCEEGSLVAGPAPKARVMFRRPDLES